jgi:hypothetical protein
VEDFKEAYEIGSLYWDSSRIMQNFQDVQNTKKIIIKDDPVQEIDSNNSFDNIIEELLKILKMKTIQQITAMPMVTVPMKMLTLFLRKLESLMKNY